MTQETAAALQSTAPSMHMEGAICLLSGDWVVAALQNQRQVDHLLHQLSAVKQNTSWDLRNIQLDHIGGQLLLTCWQGKLPTQIQFGQGHQELFARLEQYTPQAGALSGTKPTNGLLAGVGFAFFRFLDHLLGFIQLLGQFVLDVGRLLSIPAKGPWRDFSAQILRMGAQALPITGLVGLLIGVVVVYLLGGFLVREGLGEAIVPLVGVASIRELGPLLAAILVAGRSGSTITAQIGVMRLREELDAMHVLGIPATFRLVMPRVLALALSMPFLSMWTSFLVIFGGMFVADLSMGISSQYFMQMLPASVSMGNIWMNLGKSIVFGALVALIGCHYGLRVKADTESLGNGTTASVVASITTVILADAVFAILCRNVPL